MPVLIILFCSVFTGISETSEEPKYAGVCSERAQAAVVGGELPHHPLGPLGLHLGKIR